MILDISEFGASKSSIEDICRSLLVMLEMEGRKTASNYLVVHVRGGDFKENMRLEKRIFRIFMKYLNLKT